MSSNCILKWKLNGYKAENVPTSSNLTWPIWVDFDLAAALFPLGDAFLDIIYFPRQCLTIYVSISMSDGYVEHSHEIWFGCSSIETLLVARTRNETFRMSHIDIASMGNYSTIFVFVYPNPTLSDKSTIKVQNCVQHGLYTMKTPCNGNHSVFLSWLQIGFHAGVRAMYSIIKENNK